LRDGARLAVRVTPRSSRNRIEVSEKAVRVWVTAAPTDHQANKAVCELLAEALDVPKSRVSIVRGDGSREKVIAVEGLDLAEAMARLEAANG